MLSCHFCKQEIVDLPFTVEVNVKTTVQGIVHYVMNTISVRAHHACAMRVYGKILDAVAETEELLHERF